MGEVLKKVIAQKVDGGTIILDTSDEVCRKFVELSPGETFPDPFGDQTKFVGVGKPNDAWLTYPKDREKVRIFRFLFD